MLTKTVLFVALISSADVFQLVPEQGQIEVTDNQEYTFGVNEEWSDPGLQVCYYKTDTGLQGSFPIRTFRITHQNITIKEEVRNIVTTLGHLGLCQINVKKVDASGPTKWTLTLADTSAHNITSFDFFIKFYHDGRILKYEVDVLEMNSFYNHLIPLPEQKFQLCNLKVKDLDVNLNVNTAEGVQGEGLAPHITSLGHGLCGFKYDMALHEDISYETWILTAQDTNEDWYRSTFKTIIQPTFNNFYTKTDVVLGSSVLIVCGDARLDQFCTLFNPRGEIIITENCKLYIASFGVHHLGRWKCYRGNRYSLESLEFTIEYIRTEHPKLVPVMKDSSTTLTLGCMVERYNFGEYNYCRLTAPNQKTFNVQPTAATERYTTIGTAFDKGVCLVQIQKPLLPFENGIWKCEIDGPGDNNFGGVFLSVGQVQPPIYTTKHVLKVELKQPLAVYCEVPYTSDYCYIKAPNGTTYENTVHYQVNIGKCSTSINPVVQSDNGTWKCYFARNTGIPSEEITVDVVVTDILHSYESVEVAEGSTAQLLCHAHGLPLSYCEFIAPNGTAYFVKKETSTTNLRYYGRGLEYGDCGISLVKARPDHSGIWTCAIRYVRDNRDEENSARISVAVASNLASQPTNQSVSQIATHPKNQSASHPARQTVSQPISQPANQSANQSASQTASQLDNQPACQQVGQPTNQQANQPASQPTNQPAN